jgi:hypothetical protein
MGAQDWSRNANVASYIGTHDVDLWQPTHLRAVARIPYLTRLFAWDSSVWVPCVSHQKRESAAILCAKSGRTLYLSTNTL